MRKAILAGAAAVSLLSVPALAQMTTTADDTGMMTGKSHDGDDRDDFPWGLLGLLGLAGLLGRRKHDHNEVRRNP